MKPVRIGCSGWNYPHWRELVYPKGLPARSWLQHYAGLFDTVEVNTTFYRLPRHESVASWVRETPDGFLFAVKVSRYLTHMKRLTDMARGVERFYERIEPLVSSPKLGPVLWQLPENFHRDDERLASALAQLPFGRHCFEFRPPELVRGGRLCARARAPCRARHRRSPTPPFQSHELTADWTYIRLHHGSRGRHGNYSERELEKWPIAFSEWRRRVEVLAYFNNDWNGYAVRNRAWLKTRLCFDIQR